MIRGPTFTYNLLDFDPDDTACIQTLFSAVLPLGESYTPVALKRYGVLRADLLAQWALLEPGMDKLRLGEWLRFFLGVGSDTIPAIFWSTNAGFMHAALSLGAFFSGTAPGTTAAGIATYRVLDRTSRVRAAYAQREDTYVGRVPIGLCAPSWPLIVDDLVVDEAARLEKWNYLGRRAFALYPPWADEVLLHDHNRRALPKMPDPAPYLALPYEARGTQWLALDPLVLGPPNTWRRCGLDWPSSRIAAMREKKYGRLRAVKCPKFLEDGQVEAATIFWDDQQVVRAVPVARKHTGRGEARHETAADAGTVVSAVLGLTVTDTQPTSPPPLPPRPTNGHRLPARYRGMSTTPEDTVTSRKRHSLPPMPSASRKDSDRRRSMPPSPTSPTSSPSLPSPTSPTSPPSPTSPTSPRTPQRLPLKRPSPSRIPSLIRTSPPNTDASPPSPPSPSPDERTEALECRSPLRVRRRLDVGFASGSER